MLRNLRRFLQCTSSISDQIFPPPYFEGLGPDCQQQLMPKRKHAKSLSRSAAAGRKIVKLTESSKVYNSVPSAAAMTDYKVETLNVPVKSIR